MNAKPISPTYVSKKRWQPISPTYVSRRRYHLSLPLPRYDDLSLPPTCPCLGKWYPISPTSLYLKGIGHLSAPPTYLKEMNTYSPHLLI